jgi:hypothetical protein
MISIKHLKTSKEQSQPIIVLQENIDLKATYGANYDVLLSTNFEPKNEAIQALNKAISMSSISNKYDDIKYQLTAEQASFEEERQIFNAFLDIYENESKNNAIKALLTSNADIDQETLAYLLPCNDPYVKNYFNGIYTAQPRAAQYFNKSLGRTYAIRYATTPNQSEYGYINGADCTNFASQILIAGGINMHDRYPYKLEGWWHKEVQEWHGNSYVWVHQYSTSWVNADSFVRFMGTSGNEYTSFQTFSGKLISGDFIALDYGRDGDWNHLGFVCDIGSYGTYYYTVNGVQHSKYYRNFTVAQHTGQYYAWTSSDTNGWEVADGTAKFAIVRRNAVA